MGMDKYLKWAPISADFGGVIKRWAICTRVAKGSGGCKKNRWDQKGQTNVARSCNGSRLGVQFGGRCTLPYKKEERIKR